MTRALDMALEAAQKYARLGWRVFPATQKKKPYRGCGWTSVATADPEAVAELWQRFPGECVGLVPPEGVVILDLDLDAGVEGLSALNKLAPAGEALAPATWTGPWQHTPRGGHHVPCRLPSGVSVGNKSGQLPDSIHVRGDDRGYILVEPSATEVGAYRWHSQLCRPEDLPMIPGWILEPLRKAKPRARKTKSKANGKIQPVRRGARDLPLLTRFLDGVLVRARKAVERAKPLERNITLNREAFALFSRFVANKLLTDKRVRGALARAALKAGQEQTEIDSTLNSAERSGLSNPTSWHELLEELLARQEKVAPRDVLHSLAREGGLHAVRHSPGCVEWRGPDLRENSKTGAHQWLRREYREQSGRVATSGDVEAVLSQLEAEAEDLADGLAGRDPVVAGLARLAEASGGKWWGSFADLNATLDPSIRFSSPQAFGTWRKRNRGQISDAGICLGRHRRGKRRDSGWRIRRVDALSSEEPTQASTEASTQVPVISGNSAGVTHATPQPARARQTSLVWGGEGGGEGEGAE